MNHEAMHVFNPAGQPLTFEQMLWTGFSVVLLERRLVIEQVEM